MKRNLSIPEFCDSYGPSRSKTFELLASGELQRLKIGSRTFIPIEAAEAWRARLIEEAVGDEKNGTADQPAVV